MRLPFAEQAVVAERKITHYLLNPEHPEGGSKARYFLSVGHDPAAIERFRDDLLELARTSNVEELPSRFGPKYVGVGFVTPPQGGRVQVQTIWILRNGAPPPLLVTAYAA
ncbi:MAG: DUF6883 domain-containing protein [Longimicrobiaceae bacterium]